MSESKKRYVLSQAQRGIFGEIYFPRKAAYQGAIFDALRHGYSEERVKTYLTKAADSLLDELQDHPRLFDPRYFDSIKRRKDYPTLEEAKERIRMYRSPFHGWSTYAVDGVFFDQEGVMYEEATQVVRLMFRFESSFESQATADQCQDVLRSMLFWTINRRARLIDRKPWAKAEQDRFMDEHRSWSKKKRMFVNEHFSSIVKEIVKWIDDIGLFVFAYLVRQFSEQVIIEKLYEAEIWVTSFFDLALNIVKRVELPQ